MEFRRIRRRRWLLLGTALAVVLVPYFFSRVASSWRCVSVHSAPDAQAPEAAGPGIRVASYNIAHGRGLAASSWDGGDLAERTARLEQIAELLRTIDADVVVLNEVDFESSWSYSTNQAEYLAEKAGYPFWAEERNLDFRALLWTWRHGNAVLSKHPILDARVIDYPGFSAWETLLAGKKRGLVCEIQVGDQAIQVVAAHLSHRSESLRVKSAAAITAVAEESPLPTIVAGDLNSTPPGFAQSGKDSEGNNAVATFDASGRFLRWPIVPPDGDEGLTFPSVAPECAIDWILIPSSWRFAGFRVELSQLSDHRPVVADVMPVGEDAGAGTNAGGD